MVKLKVATLIHIWVDCLSGTWRIQCGPRISRSTRVIILRYSTQAQRELRYFMLETSVCSHKLLWSLAQLSKLHEALEEVDQQMQWVVGGIVYPEQRVIASERLCLGHPFLKQPYSARNLTQEIGSCGEKCTNLCRVYKLIMVSHVPGYGQILSIQYLEYLKYLITF